MAERRNFFDMFREYEPEDDLRLALENTVILGADIQHARRIIEISMFAPEYIPLRKLNNVSSDVCRLYLLNGLELKVTHPVDQLERVEIEELRDLFVAQNSMTRGSLAGALWQWEGTTLTVRLRGNGKKELEECAVHVARDLGERFGRTHIGGKGSV